MPQQACKYRFGPFELRTRTRELYKHGIRLKLRPQAYQVLVMLLERAGDVVAREELQKGVWPSNTFVDFEHGLNTVMKELRWVLSDSVSEPKYLETLPKLGYRVIVGVDRESGAAGDILQDSEAVPAKSRSISQGTAMAGMEPGRPGRWRWGVPVLIAALAIMGIVAVVKWPRPFPEKAAEKGRMMLAVLPFENLTGDDGQDYLSDGLTEEMIAQLGRLNPQEFGVIARTSVMHYKHTSFQTEQIGRELGVQYLLEGSVRRDSAKVRINAQLIKIGSQTPLWAREYDRELANLLAVQAEIAHEISDEIQLTLGEQKLGPPEYRPTLTPQAYQAYDLYLKGLFFWNKRTVPGFQQAIENFQQAIARDANYAPAYAGLANSYTLLTSYSMAPSSKYMPKARAAALRALELDDRLPEAHVALALIVENYDWDWSTAEKEYHRAIELNPNYATAHHWYAELLTWRGRFEEALRESDMARRLDPLSLIIASDHASIFYYSRKYDQAIEQFNAVLILDPNFPRGYKVIEAYLEKGLFAEALTNLEKWSRLAGDGPANWAEKAYVYGRCGKKDRARNQLARVEAANRKQQLDPWALVLPNIGAGNNEEALSWLEKGYAQHSNSLTTIKVEPAYDPLRGDPRFQDLLRRVGLTQ